MLLIGVDDNNLDIFEQMLTMGASNYPVALEEPTIYSHLIVLVGFQLRFNPIYDRLISHGSITAQESLKFDKEISQWESSLPSFFQESAESDFSNHWTTPCKYRLHWRVRNLRMLIFFPVFLRLVRPSSAADWHCASQDERLAVLRCIDYAHQNVISIRDYFVRETSNVIGEWYAL